MDDRQQDLLAAKKREIKLRLKVDDFIKNHFLNWLEIYEIILAKPIPHAIAQLATVNAEELKYWESALHLNPFAKFGFGPGQLNTHPNKDIISRLYTSFPSTYPLRYMPCDEVPQGLSSATDNINSFRKQLGIHAEDEVYLCYLYYSPVLKLKLTDIISNAEQLFDFPMEDILIFSPHFNWIIFRSMEEEWRVCSK